MKRSPRGDPYLADRRLKRGVRLAVAIDTMKLHLQSVAAHVVTGWGPSGPVTLPPADRIIVATGQRPDLSVTRELRLDLDPWLESPRALGPLIDPNLHSCGTVPPAPAKLHISEQGVRSCSSWG